MCKYSLHAWHIFPPSISLMQDERIKVYKAFKEGQKRILVATDLVGMRTLMQIQSVSVLSLRQNRHVLTCQQGRVM